MVKKIGLALLLVAIGSAIAQLTDSQHRVLSWVNHWGEDTGWGIRAALVFVGGAMVFLEHLMGDEGLEGEVTK